VRQYCAQRPDIGEEAEVLIDAVLGALSSKETIMRPFRICTSRYTRNKSKTNRTPCSFP